MREADQSLLECLLEGAAFHIVRAAVENPFRVLVREQHCDESYWATPGAEIGRGFRNLLFLDGSMVGIQKKLTSSEPIEPLSVMQASFEHVVELIEWVVSAPKPQLLGSSLRKKGFGIQTADTLGEQE